jgi:hypothetical protein
LQPNYPLKLCGKSISAVKRYGKSQITFRIFLQPNSPRKFCGKSISAEKDM